MKTLEELRSRIDQAIGASGPYSHNIIGLVLSQIENQYGGVAVLETFREFDLESFGFTTPSIKSKKGK